MDDTLLEFKQIIDEEINAYESLSELYKVKQSILVQGKSDALWDIDAQIVALAGDIRLLNSKRRQVAGYLGNENFTMSEIIEKAKSSNDIMADHLQNQKAKLNILARSLSLQENTNLTLIKHGLTMVGKKIDIIVNAVLPHAKQYNKLGQNVENEQGVISSIVEEA